MGVPKFYWFIVDRYPCIRRIIKEHEIPTYDNLYLDMTSIVHNCSHPNDSDVYFRVSKKQFSDEDIFANVTRYIELIFRIVKPLDLMFLAFDGVAPRAKMKQQRATRFRSAQNLANMEENKDLDREELFDANCITPGTVFMAELIEHVRHFIAYKISTDPMWQNCKVILSGPEVCGEGEHKIMEFIRNSKKTQNKKRDIRHCLYSLDADMIILGLLSHERIFSIIKESIPFGKRKIVQTPEESDFQLLHLSIVREYLEHEFCELAANNDGIEKFDLEKIIDDWILISFLIGNDFIPQLPNLNIINGALQLLYQVYIKVFPTIGYINEAGSLNLKRFEKYLKCLSEIEIELLNKKFDAAYDFIRKKISKIEKKIIPAITNEDEQILEKDALKKNAQTLDKLVILIRDLELEKSEVNEWKTYYYKTKMNIDNVDKSFVRKMVEEYIRAIQWTLNYYYQGCSSWSWYYPYHYAPAISDIKNIKTVDLTFDLNEPFLPLQHLLAVLPPANSHLLPTCYQTLMTSKTSPIIDFYPEDFDIDMNEKTNDWEAVVLIPFIDEKRLLNAMEPYNKKLRSKDRSLNKIGQTCVYTYSKISLGQYPVDTIYEEFTNHAQLQYIKFEGASTITNKPIKTYNTLDNDLRLSSFPTLSHIDYRFFLAKRQRISQLQNEVESMFLKVLPKPTPTLKDAAKELLGKSVYIKWPYTQEAYVIGVTDFKDEIYLKNFWKNFEENNLKSSTIFGSAVTTLQKQSSLIHDKYKHELCIDVNETKIFAYVFVALGKRLVFGRSGKTHWQTKWNSVCEEFPYQLLVKNIKPETEHLYQSVTDMFCANAVCFVIGVLDPHYGAMGKVIKVLENQKVVVSITVSPDPDLTASAEDYFVDDSNYINIKLVAEKLKVNSIVLSRITGSLIVANDLDIPTKYYDLGLRIKSPKYNKELYKYTKHSNNTWLYSSKAVELIEMYMTRFPKIFENLKNNDSRIFTISDLFPDNPNQINLVSKWLTEQAVNYPTFLDCGTKNLGLEGVSKLETFTTKFFSTKKEIKTYETTVFWTHLFVPGTCLGLVPPDMKAQHKLLDRIICIKKNFTVPLGLKGTIVGIVEKEEQFKNVYEILFDSSFTGGLTLYNSSEHRCYRLTVADFINISHGQRSIKKDLKNGLTNNIKKNFSDSKSNIDKKTQMNTDKRTLKNFNWRSQPTAKDTSPPTNTVTRSQMNTNRRMQNNKNEALQTNSDRISRTNMNQKPRQSTYARRAQEANEKYRPNANRKTPTNAGEKKPVKIDRTLSSMGDAVKNSQENKTTNK